MKSALGFARGLKLFGLWVSICGVAFSISMCAIGIGFWACGFLLELGAARRAPKAYPAPLLLLAALGVSLLISVWISDYREVSMRGLFKYVEGFILLYVAYDTLSEAKHFRRTVGWFVWIAFVASLCGVWQDLFGHDFIFGRAAIRYRGDMLRVTGPFKHSNDYATFLVPAFLACLGVIFSATRRRRAGQFVVGALVLALSGYALTRTMSRGAYLSVFVGLFVFFTCIGRKRWWFFAVAPLVALALAIQPHLAARLLESFDNQLGNTPERLLLVGTAWRMTMAAPFFGLGLNTYSDNFPKFRPDEYHDIMYAHNTYLQMSSEAGLVGLGLLLALIGAVIFLSARSARARLWKPEAAAGAALFAGVIAFLVNGIFESCLQSTQLRTYFWLLLGACAAWSRFPALGALGALGVSDTQQDKKDKNKKCLTPKLPKSSEASEVGG